MHRWSREIVRFGLATLLVAALVGCGETRDVEVHVRYVGFDPTNRAPVVILEDRRRNEALPIWIGHAEAQAIASVLDGQPAPRPMTHDLFKSVLDEAGIGFDRVRIESLREGTYFARLFLSSRLRDYSVDARPSDAIALAVRFGRPIFIAPQLMKGAASLAPEPAAPAPSDDVATIGGVTVQSMTASLAELFGLEGPSRGVVVTDVARPVRDGPERGDVVLRVEGREVRTAAEFVARVEGAGRRRVGLSVWRGGQEQRIQLDTRAGR